MDFHNDDDDISYKSTELLNMNNEEESSAIKKPGAAILLTFIILAFVFLAAGFYIYITMTSRIRNLENDLKNSRAEASGRADADSEKISNLEEQLSYLKNQASNLNIKGKEYSNRINQQNVTLNTYKKEKTDLEEDIKSLKNQMTALEQEKKIKENELNKTLHLKEQTEEELSQLKQSTADKIEKLQSEVVKIKSEITYWQKKYDKLNKEQADAVNDILASAKRQKKIIDDLEQELYSAYEKSIMYQSLIGWEENFKLTGRLPLTKLDQKPLLLSSTRPNYPAYLRNTGIEGMVLLKAVLSEQGILTNIEVLYSPQNNQTLAQAAKEAASKYRYRPAIREGQKVKVIMIIPVDFKTG